jgi:hypothetical protein
VMRPPSKPWSHKATIIPSPDFVSLNVLRALCGKIRALSP